MLWLLESTKKLWFSETTKRLVANNFVAARNHRNNYNTQKLISSGSFFLWVIMKYFVGDHEKNLTPCEKFTAPKSPLYNT